MNHTSLATVEQATKRFVNRFIQEPRRDRVQKLLCASNPNRRLQGIQAAERWLVSYEEVAGNAQEQRTYFQGFGNVMGILVSQDAPKIVNLVQASAEAAGRNGALFIADSLDLAVLFLEFGSPLLCR